ncbi:hypothetical protein AVEN_62436-1 [Araneus ventricosus]|uniref:Uncharacterized protein n=1 Tax=Araneus ventricosus TaxID=182803 RepID=A0A4Y2TA68_ARAVE|nr:hypothetical protein AVEN_62436-1 [Araneus ventricosus]
MPADASNIVQMPQLTVDKHDGRNCQQSHYVETTFHCPVIVKNSFEINTMSSSSYTDTDVITLEYQSQNRLDFPALARECDRYGILDRAAASIVNAVLQDIGIVQEGETSHIVDLNKIRWQR